MNPATVGQLIAARRRERKLTLQRLATMVGCARSYLSMIERGRSGPPGEELLERLERALATPPGTLLRAAHWEATPPDVRREVAAMRSGQDAARRLAEILSASRGGLDRAFKSGELRTLVDRLAAPAPATPPAGSTPSPASSSSVPAAAAGSRPPIPLEVPLINSVAAGYPREFTDLGYPARTAAEYVRITDLADPDAFACRVVGDSMAPEYREGDIVVFSPARPIESGTDCFARLEPDHQTTFKRAYLEKDPGGQELIRLQPLNPAYPARTYPREQVAGLYAAVSVTRTIAPARAAS